MRDPDKARKKRERKAAKRREDALKAGQTLQEGQAPKPVEVERRRLPELATHEALGQLPPFEAKYSGTQILENAVRSIQNMARKQGHKLDVSKVNPFDAEPCAGAVMVETVRELKGMRKEVEEFAEITSEGLELSAREHGKIWLTLERFGKRLDAIEGHLGLVDVGLAGEEADDNGPT